MRPHLRVLAAWLLIVAAAAAGLAAREYRTRDPDSVLYAQIAASLVEKPVAAWIAPDFPAGSYMQGRFREHPVGLFVPAAVLGRLGYPAEQAGYLVATALQVAILLLAPFLAAAFAPQAPVARVASLLLLLPVSFVYRIRFNHETPILLFLLVALLAVERARERPAFGILAVVALDGLLLVKGMVVVPALACCGLLLALRQWEGKPVARAWIALAAAALVVAGTVAAYEAAYVQATGESFLGYYRSRWSPVDESVVAALRVRLYNLVWYTGRVLWFAAPWSVLGVAALCGRDRLSLASREARVALLFTAGVAVTYLGFFSMGGERRAERYVFPVYYAVGIAGSLAAIARWPRLARLTQRLDHPLAPPIVFAVLFFLHLFGGLVDLPRIKWWKADA